MMVVGLGFELVVDGCWRRWVCCGGAAAAGSVVLGYLIWVCCNFFFGVILEWVCWDFAMFYFGSGFLLILV